MLDNSNLVVELLTKSDLDGKTVDLLSETFRHRVNNEVSYYQEKET